MSVGSQTSEIRGRGRDDVLPVEHVHRHIRLRNTGFAQHLPTECSPFNQGNVRDLGRRGNRAGLGVSNFVCSRRGTRVGH